MITIKKIYIDKNKTNAVQYADILIDDLEKTIWFEVDLEYADYLCFERCDAYVVGMLWFAIMNGHDIASKIPISEDLFYNLTKTLIPVLVKHSSKKRREVKLNMPLICDDLTNIGAVGTGLSCGVDSFHSITQHLNTVCPSYRLTHLAHNNVGAFNACYSKSGIDKVYEYRKEEAAKLAKKLKLKLVNTNSNFQSVIEQPHLLSHTFSSMFAVLILQKLWGKYYYGSSGYDYSEFSVLSNDIKSSDHYELLSLNQFSCNSLKIYSEGGEKTRLEKIKAVLGYDFVQKNLHVCIASEINCNICSKCRRTLLALDALDALDLFANVFDITYYYKNKNEYLAWLKWNCWQGDSMNQPVYDVLKREMGLGVFVRTCIIGVVNISRFLFSRFVPGKLKLFIKCHILSR